MAKDNAIPLGDCHSSLLQRILGLCDREDIFLLRQVSRRFRAEADRRIQRCKPMDLLSDFGKRFMNVRTLDLTWCPPRSVQANLLAVAIQLPGLQTLAISPHLTKGTAPSKWLEPLGRLTALSLHGNWRPSSQLLLELTDCCTSLQRLDLWGVELQWSVFQELVTRRGGTLSDLGVFHSSFPGEFSSLALDALGLNAGKLTRLRLWYDSVSGKLIATSDWGQLAALTSLTHLSLRYTGFRHIDDFGIEALNALQQLTFLDLRNVPVTEAEVARLTALTQVVDLACKWRPGGSAANRLAALGSFPSLAALNVYIPAYFGPTWFSGTAQMLTGITQLHASSWAFLEDTAVRQSLTCLQSLHIRLPVGVDEPAAALCHLAGLRQLTQLSLQAGRKLRTEHLCWLNRLTGLHALAIASAYCSFAALSLEPLAALPALRRLDVEGLEGLCLADLLPLERLPLVHLSMPSELLEVADQLPVRLRLAALRGFRESLLLPPCGTMR